MKHKNISQRSGELLAYFNENSKPCFTIEDARKVLTQTKKGAVLELLSDMSHRGLLLRIKQGVYYIIPYEQDPKSFMPDWHLLAKYIVGDAKYYIGYFSAMQIHSLITQPALKEQIVVNKQIKPSSIEIKGVTFQFIYHNEKHFFGNKKSWVDSFNKVECSDLEKTFIDALFKPEYAGGITEITKALHKCKDKLDYTKLLEYALKFDSIAVNKRLGYLLELLQITTPIIESLRRQKTSSYFLLEPQRVKQGKRLSKWNIQENIDKESILSPIYT